MSAAETKFSHPWMRTLPPGRARTYDLAYKTTTTLLAAFAAYGFVEVVRGAWFIASTPSASEPSKVGWTVPCTPAQVS